MSVYPAGNGVTDLGIHNVRVYKGARTYAYLSFSLCRSVLLRRFPIKRPDAAWNSSVLSHLHRNYGGGAGFNFSKSVLRRSCVFHLGLFLLPAFIKAEACAMCMKVHERQPPCFLNVERVLDGVCRFRGKLFVCSRNGIVFHWVCFFPGAVFPCEEGWGNSLRKRTARSPLRVYVHFSDSYRLQNNGSSSGCHTRDVDLCRLSSPALSRCETPPLRLVLSSPWLPASWSISYVQHHIDVSICSSMIHTYMYVFK